MSNTFNRPLYPYSYSWTVATDETGTLVCADVFGLIQITTSGDVTITYNSTAAYVLTANNVWTLNPGDVHISRISVSNAAVASATVKIFVSAPIPPTETVPV